jgi:formylglycine-generating enzyme required for sulfatase activity
MHATTSLHASTAMLVLVGLFACKPDGGGSDASATSTESGESDEIGETATTTTTDTESTSESTTESTTDTTESTTDTTESTTDTTESTTDTTESTTDTTETTTESESGLEGCAAECGTPGCGQCPNAPTVLGPGYRIERTEVRVGDYALFLELPFSPALLHEDCGWKVGFEPDDWDAQLVDPDMPVVDVDWCDAEAYCRWAGRHLCGQIGGGPAPFDAVGDADTEWFAGCSSQDTFNFPYGDVYQPTSCNGVDLQIGAPVQVGSLPDCEGGLPNLLDMSGNVREWADACDTNPNVADDAQQCQRRGGSYVSASMSLNCFGSADVERSSRTNTTGIRCCDMP